MLIKKTQYALILMRFSALVASVAILARSSYFETAKSTTFNKMLLARILAIL